ncbi:B-cell differentiation antigen CD72-like [Hyperolius riggenbachi]|uniref:B-cell differentiation antigen CD72-like n=1 Tax=Hyperolius riggenbachi TaxID=752182 RepID=UPI0035A2690B
MADAAVPSGVTPGDLSSGEPLQDGTRRRRSQTVVLLLSLLCLVQCAALITLTLKYVHVAGDHHLHAATYQTENSSQTRGLWREENLLVSVRNELRAIKAELEKTQLEIKETRLKLNSAQLELKTHQAEQGRKNHQQDAQNSTVSTEALLLKNKRSHPDQQKEGVQGSSDLQHTVTSTQVPLRPERTEHLLTSVRNELTAAKSEMEKIRLELEEAVRDKISMNQSLLQCKRDERRSTTPRQPAAETSLRDTRCRLDQWKTGLCPAGWLLRGRKCLWISEGTAAWEDSQRDCEERESNLVILQRNDTQLEDSLAGEGGGFWVGKELTWRWPEQWKWPNGYEFLQSNHCWMIGGGGLQAEDCRKNNRWICERNLVVTAYKGSAYNSLEFSLWNTQFYCYRSG